jgi:hypothetical protein
VISFKDDVTDVLLPCVSFILYVLHVVQNTRGWNFKEILRYKLRVTGGRSEVLPMAD